MREVKIALGWKNVLSEEFNKDYFTRIFEFIKVEKESKTEIYPPGSLIFNAFNTTDFEQVKVVLVGQDPYHGFRQANGLSFSVQHGTKPPPSLLNIYKEIENDLGVQMSRNNGDLSPWAQQGVLLLNATLTVRAHQPNSHAGIGWNLFTDAVIQQLNILKSHLVFILWGNFAKEKGSHIDTRKHLVLKAAHPSPYSAAKGFFGCKHFSQTNQYLMKHGIDPINWKLNEHHV